MIGHAASSEGHDGVQMWFSKQLQFARYGVQLKAKNLQIVASTPAMLLVKVQLRELRCIFITGRAPHSGRPEHESRAFWDTISQHLRRFGSEWRIVFMGDTNGHLGDKPSTAIGDLAPAQENQAGRYFHDWLLEHRLFVPSTFSQYHAGPEHDTYHSPDGMHATRIDYVALSSQTAWQQISTHVDEDIDVTIQRRDHFPLLCQVQWTQRIPKHKRFANQRQRFHTGDFVAGMQDESTRSFVQAQLWSPAWHVDPHRSADHLAQRTISLVSSIAPMRAQWRRKSHVSNDGSQENDVSSAQSYAQGPAAYFPSGYVSRMAFCECAYFDFQIDSSLEATEKALLPKHRARHGHSFLADGLLQHFETLEAGTTMPWMQLHQQCLQRNLLELEQRSSCALYDLHELPTLVEVEELCLKQKPHKAPGPDELPSDICRSAASALAPALHNVILKSFLNGYEPFRYKGGYLTALWKRRGSPYDPSAYRGILLSESFGKIFHAWSRKRLLPTLQQRRAPGQLGGLPSQQTTVGIQAIRLHCRIGRLRGLSTGTLFLDLKAAFHHMLREWIFKIDNPWTQRQMAAILDPNDFDHAALLEALNQTCAQVPHDIPEGLRRLLHDMHSSTWFLLDPQKDAYTETMRGTRPGSPLADLGFNLLMARILRHLQDQLDHIPEYVSGNMAFGLSTPPVAWVDDLAIPIVTTRSSLLVPVISKVLECVHDVFTQHGMTLNFEAGKTEAVLMFRGPGAPEERAKLFCCERSPCLIVSTNTHILRLRVGSSYKHLGSRFGMNADIDLEINHRLANARQAFAEMKRSIFLNRYVSVQGRLQLYSSLILSRLLYGCAGWSDVSKSQLAHIESQMICHYRQILDDGYWKEQTSTDDDLLHYHQLQTFRVLWARHRLIYLQHLAQHGHAFHLHLLFEEHKYGQGWLHEVSDDLQWLSTFGELPFDLPTDENSWRKALESLAAFPPWKRLVSRACRKHVLQEKIAWDVKFYHEAICGEFQRAHLDLHDGQPHDDLPLQQFQCGECGMSFGTRQQLAAHAYRKHNELSVERQLAHSTVCGGCLKEFWTTWRVLQHLRYRPNGCFDRLDGARQLLHTDNITLPDHLKDVKRLPSIRRHYGPLRPTSVQRTRISLGQRIQTLRAAGENDFVWWHPDSASDLVCSAFAALDHALLGLCSQDSFTEIDFHNAIFAALFSFEEPDMKMGRLFIHWIETRFHDCIPSDLEIDMRECLERAHLSLLEDLPTWHMRLKMKRLTQIWINLPPDEPDLPVPSLPLRARPYNRAHAIESRYLAMHEGEQARLHWRFLSPRPSCPCDCSGPFFVVHLYSGRRRAEDFHFWMQHFLDANSGANILILSIDTAISDTMNVLNHKLWDFLIRIAREGRILCLLLGPPCETWSSARFESLEPGDHGDLHAGHQLPGLRGPRPLRLASSPWGIGGLSFRELQQVHIGNCLLFRGLWLAVCVALSNGAVVLEHPSAPYEDFKPSIWRTALVLLLACVLDGVQKPSAPLIGRSAATGQFYTAAAKEYPSALNKAIAMAFHTRISGLASLHRSSGPAASTVDAYGAELAAMCASTECGTMMPDYQPHHDTSA
eukprot:s2370_g4.t1